MQIDFEMFIISTYRILNTNCFPSLYVPKFEKLAKTAIKRDLSIVIRQRKTQSKLDTIITIDLDSNTEIRHYKFSDLNQNCGKIEENYGKSRESFPSISPV